MKIRIKGNTVRYRLSKTEVATLAGVGMIQDRTEFLRNVFSYTIIQTDVNELSADFVDQTITLYVPETALQQWAYSDMIGIENRMALPNGGYLYLLLEKEFKCIDVAVEEDQSDYFDNPHFTC